MFVYEFHTILFKEYLHVLSQSTKHRVTQKSENNHDPAFSTLHYISTTIPYANPLETHVSNTKKN